VPEAVDGFLLGNDNRFKANNEIGDFDLDKRKESRGDGDFGIHIDQVPPGVVLSAGMTATVQIKP
jgi:hypothetical protein